MAHCPALPCLQHSIYKLKLGYFYSPAYWCCAVLPLHYSTMNEWPLACHFLATTATHDDPQTLHTDVLCIDCTLFSCHLLRRIKCRVTWQAETRHKTTASQTLVSCGWYAMSTAVLYCTGQHCVFVCPSAWQARTDRRRPICCSRRCRKEQKYRK